MENNIPTAEEFFKEKYGVNDRISTSNATLLAIEFAKLHVEAALKSASEKANVIETFGGMSISIVNKNSILNSYPGTNIK